MDVLPTQQGKVVITAITISIWWRKISKVGSRLRFLWIISAAGKGRECMTSLQISCSDRNIFTSGGIRSTPGGFCGTGHSCCVCAPYCMLFRAHYGGIREVGKACHKPATKESPHSGSWTSLHWRTNCVSQLTFGEKVGPLMVGGRDVEASGPLAI